MKIQFGDNEIRIRISQREFEELKSDHKLWCKLDYLPLDIQLSMVDSEKSGFIKNFKIELFLTADNLLVLARLDSKKSGIKLLLRASDNSEVVADVQVDLHSKKE